MGEASKATEDRWDARLYESKHAFVWKYGAALLEMLAPQSGERILDLGCGTGHLTAQLAAAGANVIGLDQSPAMIEQAKKAYPQLQFVPGDARDFAFAEPFDAVFSNATLHWIREAERAIACVRRALKPGGRFVAEFGGKGNVKAICAALMNAAQAIGLTQWQHSWYYPSIGEYTALLERDGLEVTYAHLFDRPTALEGEEGMRDWIAMFRCDLLNLVPSEKRDRFWSHIETELRPTFYRDGQWFADYRRLRIVATRVP
jgi:trans-aconitate methyltransferase